MDIVLFGSEYGTAKSYAVELAKRIGAECIPYDETKHLDKYNTVIYVGALYAGGVVGLKTTLKKHDFYYKRFIIATVGLADPTDEQNIHTIRKGIERQLPADIFRSARIYHLRGGIDYFGLGLKHKTMMGLLYKKAIHLPEDKKTAEVRAMIDTYNKKVSFVDFSTLGRMIDDLKSDTFRIKKD